MTVEQTLYKHIGIDFRLHQSCDVGPLLHSSLALTHQTLDTVVAAGSARQYLENVCIQAPHRLYFLSQVPKIFAHMDMACDGFQVVDNGASGCILFLSAHVFVLAGSHGLLIV